MAVGLVGETLPQSAAWCLFPQYLFFSHPIRPCLHPKLLRRGPAEGNATSSPGSLLCCSGCMLCCWGSLPMPHITLPPPHPLGSPGALWPPCTAGGTAVLALDHPRPPRNLPPCRAQPGALFAPASGAVPGLSSACCPGGHLHHCAPKLLGQHLLTL